MILVKAQQLWIKIITIYNNTKRPLKKMKGMVYRYYHLEESKSTKYPTHIWNRLLINLEALAARLERPPLTFPRPLWLDPCGDPPQQTPWATVKPSDDTWEAEGSVALGSQGTSSSTGSRECNDWAVLGAIRTYKDKEGEEATRVIGKLQVTDIDEHREVFDSTLMGVNIS